jgi:hypothetical protein
LRRSARTRCPHSQLYHTISPWRPKNSGSLNDALFGFGDAARSAVIAWIAAYYLDPLVNELLRGDVMAAGEVARL